MIDLGNYDECLSVDVKEEWGSFVGQHCIAEITVPVDTESIKLPFHLTNLPLGWSLCIPSSCSSGDLEKLMRIFIPLNLTVKPDTCSSHNLDAPFRPIDWIATYERHFMWLTIFSWYKNGKQLLSTKSHPDSIPILHGIRFFSIAWVVLGHSYQFRGMIPEMNLLDGEEDCVPVAWFLAVDMQLYWISPIFLLVLHKKPNFGIILLIASSLVGIALGFHQAYIYHDRPFDISERGSISERYYQTHMRFVPWLIGLGSGYLLYRTTEWRKELAEEKEHISKKAVAGLWFFIIILCVGVIHWVYPFEQKDYKYNALETALYLTLSRPLWAIGVSCLIFICTCGYGGFVNSFLTWNVFQPLSRLSFCIYLTHVSILVVILGKVKVPGYLTDIDLVCIICFHKIYIFGLHLPI
ncbi:hypothetical protein C0J52_15707 [Blattella germanica]|nr:hypothetical protein C0J52_15707 [Blattella germanica]